MTLLQIHKTSKVFLTPRDVAPVLGCHPYSINKQAKADPSRLGFPVVMIGTRVLIPKARFIQWIGGESNG